MRSRTFFRKKALELSQKLSKRIVFATDGLSFQVVAVFAKPHGYRVEKTANSPFDQKFLKFLETFFQKVSKWGAGQSPA